MKRTPVTVDLTEFPEVFHPVLRNSNLFDSSCSRIARVWFLEHCQGFYLKSAAKGALEKEFQMTSYLHGKGLAAEVISYVQTEDRDWMLTTRVPGEDCTYGLYLEDPLRLCDTIAASLRSLHELDHSDCPVTDHTQSYVALAKQNHQRGICDLSGTAFTSADQAWCVVQSLSGALKSDTLIHGDYCLPNIMLDNWSFSGFIDVDHGGVGDRHIDLYWGMWSLAYNLKTDAYGSRFLDAYGRDRIDPEILHGISAFEAFG